MPWPRVLVLLYALFNLAVGIEAFARVGSTISLIASSVIAALLLGCFFLIPKKPRVGYIGATVLVIFVAGRFLPGAFGPEGKMWPNMVLGLVAVGVVVLLTAAHFTARGKSSAQH